MYQQVEKDGKAVEVEVGGLRQYRVRIEPLGYEDKTDRCYYCQIMPPGSVAFLTASKDGEIGDGRVFLEGHIRKNTAGKWEFDEFGEDNEAAEIGKIIEELNL